MCVFVLFQSVPVLSRQAGSFYVFASLFWFCGAAAVSLRVLFFVSSLFFPSQLPASTFLSGGCVFFK